MSAVDVEATMQAYLIIGHIAFTEYAFLAKPWDRLTPILALSIITFNMFYQFLNEFSVGCLASLIKTMQIR